MGDHVEFPEMMDFKKLKNLIFEEDQENVLIDAEYELYAVLVHSGPQLGYGHYYALIKSPDNYWFRMNDMDVIPVNKKHVLREQGYMVFYKRKTDNLMKSELQRVRAKNGNNNKEIVEEQKEAINANINNVIFKNDNNGNGIKVDTDLLTNDYFTNNCNQPQDLVIVDDINNGHNNLNTLPDKAVYVKVPPIATRPELNNDNNNNNNDNNGNQDAVEVFWPPMNLE